MDPGDTRPANDGRPAELDDEALAFMVRDEAERVLAWWPARLRARPNPNGPISQWRVTVAMARAGGDLDDLGLPFNREERNWCERGLADLKAAVGLARRALDALDRDDLHGALAAGFQMAVHETRGAALFVADEVGNSERRRGAATRAQRQRQETADFRARIERALDDPELARLTNNELMRRLQARGDLPAGDRVGASERTQKRWIRDAREAKRARANR